MRKAALVIIDSRDVLDKRFVANTKHLLKLIADKYWIDSAIRLNDTQVQYVLIFDDDEKESWED